MGVSKVEVVENGTPRTLIDLTSDTVTAENLAIGYTAHGADGNSIVGTYGGKIDPLIPASYDYNIGYVDNGTWKYENPTNTYTDIYAITANRTYCIMLDSVVGSRFRAMTCTTDVRKSTSNVTGTMIVNKNTPSPSESVLFTASATGWLIVAKDNAGVTGLKTFVYDMAEIRYGTDGRTSSSLLTMGTIRPDAELLKTYTYDKWLLADEVIESWPGYNTTAQTLVATADLGTYQADVENYSYSVLLRMLCKPTYSTNSVAKGRVEYWMGSYMYDLCDIPPNLFVAASGKKFATRNLVWSGNPTGREFYWSSATNVNVYSTASYGVYQTATTPGISSANVITIKSPAFATRGHTTYFTSTFMNAVTDVRYQYVIELYRSAKNNMNIDGFVATMQAERIMDCVNNNDFKLT